MHFIVTLIAALIVGIYTYKKKVPVNAKTLFFMVVFGIFMHALSDFIAGFIEGIQSSMNSR
ncbi:MULTISPECIES: hypothetical protein [Mammaliicoccus]|uniref:Metal-dependent hydrolase n=1 Tax=Mammaliicoccus sciuri TaxID=1296 RepID=A0ABT7HZ33_MAMSC|nr:MULTISPECIES: hypothetical protein [Mammaliicoccus]MCJ0914373.1 hypothetical protein [Mammaliicoccus sciuri]MDL0112914.1 hypothetical protein [Mammaliicoccus sciuri]MDL0117421.1 hypothetical protein [Mammaliicoccus sciuri]WQJ65787.1 hypothetical protein P3T97_13685 [Mammaliicoccus sciuri]